MIHRYRPYLGSIGTGPTYDRAITSSPPAYNRHAATATAAHLPTTAMSDTACRLPGLSVTAVGARRGLVLGLPGLEEDVGLIGVHWQGRFIELVPWSAEVEWQVEPWGKWWVGKNLVPKPQMVGRKNAIA